MTRDREDETKAREKRNRHDATEFGMVFGLMLVVALIGAVLWVAFGEWPIR